MCFKHIAAWQNPVPEFCQFTVMDTIDAEIFFSGQINRKQKKGIKVFVKAVHGTGHDKFSRFFHRVHEAFDFLCPGVHDGVRDCRILSPDIIVNVQKSDSKPSVDKLSTRGFPDPKGPNRMIPFGMVEFS